MDEQELTRGLARVLGRRRQSASDHRDWRVAGGGCLVAHRTLLTCAHVVEDALGHRSGALRSRPQEPVWVDFPHWPEYEPVPARVRENGWFPVDREHGDVAALELLGDPPPGARHPPLRRPPTMMDHPFSVEGFPAGNDDAWATGLIRGPTHGGRWVQLEDVKSAGNRIERGFSGSPVWDRTAEAVVGIIVVSDTDRTTKAARLIPVGELQRLWPALEQSIGWRLRYDAEDLSKHWGPRARGLQLGHRASSPWLFTGRTRVLRELAAWLAPDAPPGGRVVVGRPGYGKSAILARLVTLADREMRALAPLDAVAQDTIPREGAIDVAVHARGKTLNMVVAKIASWMDVEARSAGELVRRLTDDDARPCTIVIDALDEALGMDARRIAMELLNPLVAEGTEAGIKVLIGTRHTARGQLLSKLSNLDVLDLDRSEYFEERDLFEYAQSILLTDAPKRGSPYRDRPELAASVAQAVARRAAPSFLLAQLAAHALVADSEVIDIERPGWEQQIPGDVGKAMDEYLGRFGEREQLARDLLRPLAFAQGAGLPHGESLWAALASGLAEREYTHADVVWLLDDSAAADYLIEGSEDGAESGSSRLYHEALAEHLRACETGGEAAVHRRFAKILGERVPRDGDGNREWGQAGEYTRKHLATHAARGGCLDELVADPGFLLAVEPTRLLRALPSALSPQAAMIGGVYRRATARISGRIRDRAPGEAAAYLELQAHQAGAVEFAQQLGRIARGSRWCTRWVGWSSRQPYMTIGWHGADIAALATCTLDGEPVILSGGDDGLLRRWSIPNCQPLGLPMRAHRKRITSIATGALDGRSIAVTGGRDHCIYLWDLHAGEQIGGPLRGHTAGVTQVAICEPGGRPIAVSAGLDDTIRIWDLDRRVQLEGEIRADSRVVAALAVGEIQGVPIAVSAGYEVVKIWDLNRRAEIGGPLPKLHLGGVSALAIGEIDGRVLAVSGGWDKLLHVWDVAAHRPRSEVPLGSHGSAIATVAFGEQDGMSILVSGAVDGTVRIWQLPDGNVRTIEVGTAINAIALAVLDDRPLAISAGEGGSLDAWDLRSFGDTQSDGNLHSHRGPQAAGDSHDSRRRQGSRDLRGSGGLADFRGPSGSGGLDDFHGSRGLDDSLDPHGPRDLCSAMFDAQPAAPGSGLRAMTPAVPDSRFAQQPRSRSRLTAITYAPGIPIVTASDDGTVVMWSERGRQRALIDTGAPAFAVTAALVDDAPLVVAGGWDGVLRTWNVRNTSVPLDPVGSHRGWVAALAAGSLAGQPVLASAGSDGAVRIWCLRARRPLYELHGHNGAVTAVALTTIDGTPVSVGAGADGHVLLWKLTEPTPAARVIGRHSAGALAVATGEIDGEPVVASGGLDGRVRLWNPYTGLPFPAPAPQPAGAGEEDVACPFAAEPHNVEHGEATLTSVTSVATMRMEDRSIMLAGTRSGHLHIWDLGANTSWAIELGSPVWGVAPCEPPHCAIACTLGVVTIGILAAAGDSRRQAITTLGRV